jgi:hypothetical protein
VAIILPIPREPPVTKAVRPVSEKRECVSMWKSYKLKKSGMQRAKSTPPKNRHTLCHESLRSEFSGDLKRDF